MAHRLLGEKARKALEVKLRPQLGEARRVAQRHADAHAVDEDRLDLQEARARDRDAAAELVRRQPAGHLCDLRRRPELVVGAAVGDEVRHDEVRVGAHDVAERRAVGHGEQVDVRPRVGVSGDQRARQVDDRVARALVEALEREQLAGAEAGQLADAIDAAHQRTGRCSKPRRAGVQRGGQASCSPGACATSAETASCSTIRMSAAPTQKCAP